MISGLSSVSQKIDNRQKLRFLAKILIFLIKIDFRQKVILIKISIFNKKSIFQQQKNPFSRKNAKTCFLFTRRFRPNRLCNKLCLGPNRPGYRKFPVYLKCQFWSNIYFLTTGRFVPRHSLLQSLILDDHFEPSTSPVAFVVWFSIDGQKPKTSSKEKTRQIDFRQKFGCLREVRVFFFQNLMARHCFGQKFPKQKKTAKFPKIPCNLKSKKILLSECGFGYF